VKDHGKQSKNTVKSINPEVQKRLDIASAAETARQFAASIKASESKKKVPEATSTVKNGSVSSKIKESNIISTKSTSVAEDKSLNKGNGVKSVRSRYDDDQVSLKKEKATSSSVKSNTKNVAQTQSQAPAVTASTAKSKKSIK
jgi:hypothetical protein